jgi:dihydrofolate reductase
MRKIVALMHMSLDGYAAGPSGEMNWIKFDEQVFTWVEQFIGDADTGLYGPKTFQMMESHWPAALRDPDARGHQRNHAQWYAKAAKVVFSRSLERLDNPEATLVTDDLAGRIADLKDASGKDLMIFGSPRLVHSFAQLGLIDEYVLTISPVILGAGIPVFPGLEDRIGLRLLASEAFDVGSVGMHYVRVTA